MSQKTSIVIINKKSQKSETINVPIHIVKYWKQFSVGFFTLTILSLLALWYNLNTKHNKAISSLQTQHAQELTTAKNKLYQLQDKVDIEELKLAFASIDESIGEVHNYLAERGINVNNGKQPSLDDLEQGSANLYAAYYKQYAERLNEQISTMPIGIPTDGAITSTFGTRSNPFTGTGAETHKGLDFKGPIGQNIKSTAAGRVKLAAFHGGYGNCVIVDHGNGYETLYGHLSAIKVQPGQVVRAGQEVGKLGSTGRSTGPHLHYEVMRNGEKINPEGFLRL